MSNKARKARKKAGEKFTHPTKTPGFVISNPTGWDLIQLQLQNAMKK